MAKRMFHSEILDDKKYISLSDKSRLLWNGLILKADDLGRGKCDFQTLKNKVFPKNHISLNKIAKLFTEIRKKMNKYSPSIQVYRKNSETFYQLLNWEEYQYIRKDRLRESKLPTPPTTNRQPNDNQTTTKRQPMVGIVKDSIDKYREEKRSSSNNPYYKKTGEEIRYSKGYKKGDRDYKPFFKGNEMRWSQNKWWVIEQGDWKEFGATEKEIEWQQV